jgi:hypothetical protein
MSNRTDRIRLSEENKTIRTMLADQEHFLLDHEFRSIVGRPQGTLNSPPDLEPNVSKTREDARS